MRKCLHWEKHQQSPWQYLLSSLWNDIPGHSLQSPPGFLLINMQQSKESPPGWPYSVFNMLLPIPMEFAQISVISLWGPHSFSPWKPCSFSLPSTHSVGHVGGVLPNVTTKTALDFKKYSFIIVAKHLDFYFTICLWVCLQEWAALQFELWLYLCDELHSLCCSFDHRAWFTTLLYKL